MSITPQLVPTINSIPPLPQAPLPPPLASSGLYPLTPYQVADHPPVTALYPLTLSPTHRLLSTPSLSPHPYAAFRQALPPTWAIHNDYSTNLQPDQAYPNTEHRRESNYIPASPGQSPIRTRGRGRPRRSPSPPPFLVPALAQLEHSAHVTRAVPRDAWRRNITSPFEPPLSVPSSLLHDQVLQSTSLTPSITTHSPKRFSAQVPTHSPPSHLFSPLSPATNAIASVIIDHEATQHALACPLNGLVSSLSLLLPSLDPAQPLTSLVPPQNIPVFSLEHSHVYHMATAHAQGSDPATLVLSTAETLTVVTATTESICFHNQVSFSNTSHFSLNPCTTDELALLSKEGLHITPLSRLSTGNFHECQPYEIQPIAPDLRFNTVHYSIHPRILLLSNTRRICQYDLRAPATSATTLLDLTSDWCLAPPHNHVSAFLPLSGSDPRALVVTPTRHVLVDLRAPSHPLLEAEVPQAESFQSTAAARVHDGHVFALARPHGGMLRVLQTSVDTDMMPKLTNETSEPPVSGLVWADAPLDGLKAMPPEPVSAPSGLAVVPVDDGAAVAQWSLNNGLHVYALAPAPRGDARQEGEPVAAGQTAVLDSSVNARNWRERLRRAGWAFDKYCAESREDEKPVSRSWPGMAMLGKTRTIPWIDGFELRARIVNETEDEHTGRMGRGSAVRVPRPRLGDLRAIQIMRDAVYNTRGGSKEEDGMEREGGNEGLDFREHLRTRGGWTLEEIARVVRSGMSHAKTPIGMEALRDALEMSEFIKWEDVSWHTGCSKDECHVGGTAVFVDGGSSREGGRVPDWVERRIYFVDESDDEVDDQDGKQVCKEEDMIDGVDDGDDDGGEDGVETDESGFADKSDFGKLLQTARKDFFHQSLNFG